ncbi:protein kinase, putative [Talaromyces stipitatus ATCC 10500]|uniref:Protein kinase, putative n=1 Tax=Talaromyces stipitatus (strain ATCC 10500 / CBS 375.48 / QM 6759 / NRRL 1006) TaxID=441959 RepID=B8MR02_TALSN|nr:protein kinase, putative [Talaromyces stipitatus ATCC 10500]EED12837.1 protein kinase, putative [Talaromyces stipitatus ATCC 10500]
MSMFRSAADISSSDPESSSEETENDSLPETHIDTELPTEASASLEELLLDDYDLPTPGRIGQDNILGGALDLDADGHASVMTSALLEFFCLTRAADFLNAQPGSFGRLTRDSPEVKQLGKKMFQYKSQFLSSHGVVAGGIEDDDWERIRQYYRDNLDMLGNAAIGDASLANSSGRPGSREGRNEFPRAPLTKSQSLISTTKIYQAAMEPDPSESSRWNIQRRNPGPPVNQGHSETFLHLNNLLRTPQLPGGETPGPMALVSTKYEPTIDHTSRYASEFVEVKLLGRGSFGQVFEARHHVDGQSYAVKKIPLSKWRLEMLQQEGVQHLEHILKEIRTLARLEHKNVVRYFGAWVEERYVCPETAPLDPGEDVHMGVEPSKEQHDPAEEDQSFGIVFGLSSNDGEYDDDNKSDSRSHGTGTWSNSHQRRNSRFTNASSLSKKSTILGSGEDDDEDVESIQRNFSIPKAGVLSHDYTSTSDLTGTDIFTNDMSEDPSKFQLAHREKTIQNQTVVLHIQMSLHPLTLSAFLNPKHRSASACHCFHLLPSLRILLGILSGVEYLHSKGIVHRDLKPANIFLSAREDNEGACHSCRGIDDQPIRNQYRPRIGDFGLVADISHCAEKPVPNGVVTVQTGQSPRRRFRHVGTEFYCPPRPDSASNPDSSEYAINEKLDVFALGVILFELLYRLGTKMERQLVLSQLTRHGSRDGIVRIPDDFEDKIECGRVKLRNGMSVAESLSTCIQGMLHPDSSKRWSCEDIRMSLKEIIRVLHGADVTIELLDSDTCTDSPDILVRLSQLHRFEEKNRASLIAGLGLGYIKADHGRYLGINARRDGGPMCNTNLAIYTRKLMEPSK